MPIRLLPVYMLVEAFLPFWGTPPMERVSSREVNIKQRIFPFYRYWKAEMKH